MLKSILLGLILLGSTLSAKSITLAAAANLNSVLEKLLEAFENKYPQTQVKVILGSSGKLTAQIQRGAPFDLFMSADTHYPQKLFNQSLSLSPPQVYAKGTLVLFANKTADFSLGLSLLTSDKVSKIALANPKTAPYGKAALEVLKKKKLLKQIHHKLVYAESVAQTLVYSMLATDFGLVAKSALFSAKMKGYKKGKHWDDISPSLYEPINQAMLVLKASKNTKEAQTFYDFVLSAQAQTIFRDFGYTLP